MGYSLFGKGYPKFVYDLGGASEHTCNLEHWVPADLNFDIRNIVVESELEADRSIVDRGEYLEIPGKLLLFKYGSNAPAKLIELLTYKKKEVVFYPFTLGEYYKDSDGNAVLFYIEFMQPKYFQTLDWRDVVYINFKSLKEVDFSQTADNPYAEYIIDDKNIYPIDDKNRPLK